MKAYYKKCSNFIIRNYFIFSIIIIGIGFAFQFVFGAGTKFLTFLLPLGIIAALLIPVLIISLDKIKENYLPAIIFSFILAFCAIPLIEATVFDKFSIIIKIAVLMGYFAFFAVLFTSLGIFIKNLTFTDETASNRKVFINIFLFSLLSLLVMWFFYFPYIPSTDAMTQWNQIHNITPYSNIHAIAHTIFLKVFLLVVDNYGIVCAVHILLVSVLFGLFGVLLAKRGISYKVLTLVTVFAICALMPIQYLFYPQKDVVYTVCLGGITLGIMYFLDTGKLSITKAIGIGICLAFATLFRHNGIIATVACSIYFFVALIKHKNIKSIIAMAITVTVCFLGINYYAYHILNTQNEKNGFALQAFGSGIAAVVSQNKHMSIEELNEINKVLPVKWMAEKYSPWEHNRLIWDNGLQNEFVSALAANSKEVISLYFKLLPNNFMIMLKDIFYNTCVVYAIYLYNFLQCNVFLFAILIFAAIISAKRNKHTFGKYFIVMLPLICNFVSIALSTITNEGRYLMPTTTLFIFIFLYIISLKKSNPIQMS